MDAAAFRDLVVEYARPSQVFDRTEQATVEKLAVLSADYLDHKARALVKGANNRPMLMSFGSDGTTLLSRKHFSFEVGSHRKRKSVGSGMEYLIQKAYLKTVP